MKKFVYVVFCLIALVLFSTTLFAQKPRRTPKPLATPLPTLSGAEIISRAGDYDDSSSTETPTQTTPKTGSTTDTKLKSLSQRVNKLEAAKPSDADEKQRRMLLNLDILTRAEQRSESLRKQLFEMIEKENDTKTRLDEIDIQSRAENIERVVQVAGSLRPEEVRETRRKSLEAERTNLASLLAQIQSAKATISTSLEKADSMVEKLRTKLEKEIDDTYLNDTNADQKPDER